MMIIGIGTQGSTKLCSRYEPEFLEQRDSNRLPKWNQVTEIYDIREALLPRSPITPSPVLARVQLPLKTLAEGADKELKIRKEASPEIFLFQGKHVN